MTDGPDGAVWFTVGNGSAIGRVTSSGAVTEYAVPGAPQGVCNCKLNGANNITVGADDAIWSAVFGGVRRTALDGSMGAYGTTVAGYYNQAPRSITAGPDGDLWFTVAPSDSALCWVGKLTPSGVVSAYSIPASVSTGVPTVIIGGPDHALWFGEQGVIGRLDPSVRPDSTAAGPEAPGTGAAPPLAGSALLLAGAALLSIATAQRAVSIYRRAIR